MTRVCIAVVTLFAVVVGDTVTAELSHAGRGASIAVVGVSVVALLPGSDNPVCASCRDAPRVAAIASCCVSVITLFAVVVGDTVTTKFNYTGGGTAVAGIAISIIALLASCLLSVATPGGCTITIAAITADVVPIIAILSVVADSITTELGDTRCATAIARRSISIVALFAVVVEDPITTKLTAARAIAPITTSEIPIVARFSKCYT
jgi:hypothetical protein